MTKEFCRHCGEPLDTQYNYADTITCPHCDETTKPIDDPDNADLPIGAHHTVVCIDCEHTVSLIGIHRGEYTDGVSLGCDCTTLGSLPAELSAGELPSK